MSFVNKLLVAPTFGDLFVIRGKTSRNQDLFNLNLSSDAQITTAPLHLSFRLRENLFVRNNKVNGIFDGAKEERTAGFNKAQFNIRTGEEFLIQILVGTDRFHISLNNVHFCDFVFRPITPITLIKYLVIDRELEALNQCDHRKIFPSVHPQMQLSKSWFSFSSDVPVPLRIGNVVTLRGVTSGNRQGSFYIRFMVSHTEKSAFSLAARFKDNVVVRNHSVNDKNEFNSREEDRSGGFPFSFGTPFKIAIGLTEKAFRVAINGRVFTDYPLKAAINTLTGLKLNENDGLILRIQECEYLTLDAALRSIEHFSR
jgi:hypothetical protein